MNQDNSSEYRFNLTVTDIKQYVYCPRIIYYTYVLPVNKKPTFKMEHGKDRHLEIDRLEKRRKLVSYGFEEGERIFHLPVYSERLGLSGLIDMVIEFKKGKLREYYPVEFKNTVHQIQQNHKYQLVAYAMLLEEHYNKPVRRGFIYTIPNKDIQVVTITDSMRIYVKKVISAIYNMIKREKFPEARSVRRCWDCEYKNYCKDMR
ncbi:MAG: CRISPR-associated exonuclease Cas4 [Thermoanaerobacteraceae bacterium]|jgi:CRISPR-associated exonuclease Cas4|nr:CRISPR-associated exonuclease Cas4 [Thermoanaerobacteraceae bacterium]